MIRILIIAGVRLYREGLAQLISRHAEFEVVAHADVPAGPDPFGQLAPDVVLLDMATPASQAIARRLIVMTPSVRIIAIGVLDSDAEVLACAEAGAVGYVTRDGSFEELVAAVQHAARGELHVTPRLAASLARRLAALAAAHQPEQEPTRLSRREREIAALLTEDLSNKEIAVRLGIEVATVKNHVHNLLEKLNVHRRSDAARAARRISQARTPTLA
jgi:two-component system, NarL family, nitrate/nitrite response regulator NarL